MQIYWGPLRRDLGLDMFNSQLGLADTWRAVSRKARYAILPFRVISLRYRWFAADAA
jgi:hypothetical protein